MELLDSAPWLAWLVLALVLGAIEALTADLTFLMLGGGAVAGALTAFFGGPVLLQVVLASVAALALLLLVRPALKRRLFDSDADHGIGLSGLIGREAFVLAPVDARGGRIKLAGEVWSARSEAEHTAFDIGDTVRVLAIDGATAVVGAPATVPRATRPGERP